VSNRFSLQDGEGFGNFVHTARHILKVGSLGKEELSELKSSQ